jgi:hypothetical protein
MVGWVDGRMGGWHASAGRVHMGTGGGGMEYEGEAIQNREPMRNSYEQDSPSAFALSRKREKTSMLARRVYMRETNLLKYLFGGNRG